MLALAACAAASLATPFGWRGVALSTALFLPHSSAYLEVDEDVVKVRMGWAFRARFPRSAVVGTSHHHGAVVSRGAHGFAGRWLVNGSGEGILVIDLHPVQRAQVLGVPVRLRQLMVSVDSPDEVAALVAVTSDGAECRRA